MTFNLCGYTGDASPNELFDIPMVIIINKADLVSDEALQKLKERIESLHFEKCEGVCEGVGHQNIWNI